MSYTNQDNRFPGHPSDRQSVALQGGVVVRIVEGAHGSAVRDLDAVLRVDQAVPAKTMKS